MPISTIILLAVMSAGASVIAAAIGVALLGSLARGDGRATAEEGVDRMVILVEDGEILDASPSARDLLSGLGLNGWSWRQLHRHLAATYPGFAEAWASLDHRRSQTLGARDGTGSLMLRSDGSRLRLHFREGETERVAFDRASYTALEDEMTALRTISDGLPHPIWRQDAEGTITWVNRAFLDLSRQTGDQVITWPPKPLFDATAFAPGEPRRLFLTDPTTGAKAWFDCQAIPIGEDLLVSANSADALVNAESTLRDVVQTMSRTFAHLTTGLAVFDRRRRLVVFNPALTDLTQLPIDLMLSRPTLDSFLDALRARNMMPEPKNYASWRDAVMQVERGAADGTYEEVWHLPAERTYRVTGRPQSDGAFALLIEDVSAEISLTRRFRAQIETGRNVLDTLDEAIAVFDRSGVITMTNAAYDRLWGLSTSDGVTHLDIQDAFETWVRASEPCGTWSDAKSFMTRDFERASWEEAVALTDGRTIEAKFDPLPRGASMARFRTIDDRPQSPLFTVASSTLVQDRLKA